MKKLTKTLPLWMALLVFISCDKEVTSEPFHYDREVIAIFPPEGIEAHTFSASVYQGIYRAASDQKVLFRPVLPATYEDGITRISQISAYPKQGIMRLIIVVDPTYAEDLVAEGIVDNMVNTDSTKVVILGANVEHPNIYSAYIPPYGMMYKAGYITSRMDDVENARLFIANDSRSYYKEAVDGFTHGFEQEGKKLQGIDNMEGIFLDDRAGYVISDVTYSIYAAAYAETCDLVMPLCRESAMGFYRYNREHPGEFYTIGMDNDMSDYANDVPFSCVSRWDNVAESVVSDWSNNRLERSRKYGLEEGFTSIVPAARYKHIIKPLSDEIHNEAIRKENEYIR